MVADATHSLAIRHMTGAQRSKRITMVTPCSGGGAWAGVVKGIDGLGVLVTLSLFRHSVSCSRVRAGKIRNERKNYMKFKVTMKTTRQQALVLIR